jgi:FkbM family methyltransferase
MTRAPAQRVVRWVDRIWSHPASEKRRIRQLIHAAGVRARLAAGQRVTTPIGEHSRMWVYPDSAASLRVAYHNPPDYAEWQVWKRHLKRGDLFVDVGANVGTYSLLVAELGATVIAVEPDPDNVDRLNANLRLNGRTAEIWVVALTNSAGPATFSTGLDSLNHLWPAGDCRTVRGERFDSLINCRHVHGVKIDVEGAEHMVLNGASGSLAAGRVDLMQLEWNQCSRDNFGESREPAAKLLNGYGYALYRATRDGRLTKTDPRDENSQDVFAARQEVAATLSETS